MGEGAPSGSRLQLRPSRGSGDAVCGSLADGCRRYRRADAPPASRFHCRAPPGGAGRVNRAGRVAVPAATNLGKRSWVLSGESV